MFRTLYLLLITLLPWFIAANEVEHVDHFSSINQELSKSAFSGSVLIVNRGKTVFQNHFGYANRETKITFTDDTVFDIGSITKQFTASAIMLLVEQGKLALEDPLPNFFQAVPKDKQGITVHQLLSHSSGLPTNLDGYRLYEVVSAKKLTSLVFRKKLDFDPGTQFQYSNLGYSLLGLIIEKVSQENWEAFIRDNILLPAGLKETGYRLVDFPADRLTVNYGADANFMQRLFGVTAKSRAVGTSLQHLQDKPGRRWMEAGGGFMSTLADMKSWYAILRKGSILSADSWQALFTPHSEQEPGKHSFYGCGWSLEILDGQRHINHNGSNGYSYADFNYFPNADLLIFAASNDIDNYPHDLMLKLKQTALALTVTPENNAGPLATNTVTPQQP